MRASLIDLSTILSLSIFWRVFTCEYMMLADQDHKWLASKVFIQHGMLTEWNQHVLRWMSTAPLIVINRAFGFNPAWYYALPIVLGTLAAVAVYLIMARLLGRFAGICIALAAVVFPPMVSAGSQLEPTANMLPFVLLAFHGVMLWEGTRKTAWLAWSGASLFLGYGAKINALIFAVPLAAYIAWSGFLRSSARSRAAGAAKDVLVFCVPVLAGMLGEGLLLFLLSGYPYGRVFLEMKGAATDAVRMQGYGYAGFEYSTVTEYLLSIRELLDFDIFYKASLLCGIITSLFVAIFRVRTLYLFSACFLFDFVVSTYMVRSMHSFALAQPHYSRYYIVTCMLGALVTIGMLFGFVACRVGGLTRIRKAAYLVTVVLCAVLALGKEDYWRVRKDFWDFMARPNGILLTFNNDKLIKEALNTNGDVAIEIRAACDGNCNLKDENNLSLNGEARAHSFWAYYGELDAMPDFAAIHLNRMCSRTDVGKLWIFPYGISGREDHPVLLGRDGGIRYEWAVFRAQDFCSSLSDTP